MWIWQLRTTVYFCSIHLHVHTCILLGGRELGWREVVETSCLCDSSRLQDCSFFDIVCEGGQWSVCVRGCTVSGLGLVDCMWRET